MNQTTSGQLFDSQTALVSKLFNFWDALDPKIWQQPRLSRDAWIDYEN